MLKKSQEMLSNPPQQQGREPTVRPKETTPPASEGRKIIYDW
jgi:hypothetical protein